MFIINNARDKTLINERITAKEVLVIGPNGEQMGIKPINDALTLASYAELDLVLLSPNATPPVAKIMDYNKYKYERSKKLKESKKRQRANNLELKEFRLSPVIDVGDIDTRVRQVTRYLEKGHKIKLTVRFRGRQIQHPELGREVLDDFAKRVSELATIEQEPKFESRMTMTMLLTPIKK